MKKIFVIIWSTALLTACSKTEIQKTTDSIKRVDSLFTTANDGFKTLDSISKILNDSAKVNAEIRKQTDNVEKVIRDNSKNLDSINAIIKKSTDRLSKSTDVIKTVDSASKVLKETNNPLEALSTISKTIEKVSKSQKTETPQKTEPQSAATTTQTEEKPIDNSQIATAPQTPMVKKGVLEMNVNSLAEASSKLQYEMQKYGGNIVSEQFIDVNGNRKQTFLVKIPYSNFDQAAAAASSGIGELTKKNIDTEGTVVNPQNLCDLEITLAENSNYATAPPVKDPSSYDSMRDTTEKPQPDESITTKIFWSALPFLPILLIVGLVWYFIDRKRRKRDAAMAQNSQTTHYDTRPNSVRAENQIKPAETTTPQTEKPSQNDDEDPYAKYKPKF